MAKMITIQQAEEIGELWFQRVNKLKEYYFNPSNPEDKRKKAFVLAWNMNGRLVAIANAILELKQINYSKFERGGI